MLAFTHTDQPGFKTLTVGFYCFVYFFSDVSSSRINYIISHFHVLPRWYLKKKNLFWEAVSQQFKHLLLQIDERGGTLTVDLAEMIF